MHRTLFANCREPCLVPDTPKCAKVRETENVHTGPAQPISAADGAAILHIHIIKS